jgi:drug/metabolite transporter (DMT)-like permease
MTEPILTVDTTAIDSSGREFKHQVFVWLAVIANTAGNFLLSVGMHAIQLKPSASPFEYVRIFTNPWIDGGVVLLIVWFASQLSLLSWADLSYLLPITATSYVLTAVLGKIFLHEFISLARWSGICVISAGVMLVLGTCPRGKLSPREIIP